MVGPRLVCWSLVAMLTGCVTSPRAGLPPLPAPSRVTRADCMNIAESYRLHRWRPTIANVLHGNDSRGVRVDTPDIGFQPGDAIPGWWLPNQANDGIPYQWGGFSSLAEYDAGIAAGRAAGDIYTNQKRVLLDDAVSAEAVGIDCSGFISRCWKLPRSYSTRELPLLCREIEWGDMLPGDIVNTHNAHCLLFGGWLDGAKTRFHCYETGCPPTWKVVSHPIPVSFLKPQGYKPYRYHGITE